MRSFIVVVKMDFMNLIKNPMWIFYATVFPIALTIIMGYLTKDRFGNGVTSFDYYGVALMLYSMLSSGMTSANAFMEEKIKRPNMRILYASTKGNVLYLSKIVSSFVFCSLFHLADMALLCLIFSIRLTHIPVLVLVSCLVELMSVTLGIMMCCIFKTEQMANQILGVVINLIAILGGLMFSLDGFGTAARLISRISPAKWLLDGTLQLIYDGKDTLMFGCGIGLALLTMLMLIVCKLTFRKEDYIC